MRRFINLVAVFLIISLSVSGQSLYRELELGFNKNDRKQLPVRTDIKLPQMNTEMLNGKGSVSQWFCLAYKYQDSLYPGGIDNVKRDYIFPDTLLKFDYSGDYDPAYTAGVGAIIDPYAPIFWKERVLKTKPYSVDSIIFPLVYTRNINNSEADTLEVEVISNYRGPMRYYLGSSSNGFYKTVYGADTIHFGTVFFDTETLLADKGKFDEEYDKFGYKHADIYTYKYLLTENDTFYDPKYNTSVAKIATPGVKSEAGTRIAVTVKFRPGYNYGEGDKSDNKNHMTFYTFQENGVDTYSTYTPGDLNASIFLLAPLYFDPTQKWYGHYYTQWGSGCPKHYQNNWLYAKLTYETDLSIAENTEKTVKLSQNIPNPAQNNTLIKYELKKSANVLLTLNDMTGRKVMEINKGKQGAGVHSINLNTNGLSNGIYYYSLVSDDSKLTMKMIVNR